MMRLTQTSASVLTSGESPAARLPAEPEPARVRLRLRFRLRALTPRLLAGRPTRRAVTSQASLSRARKAASLTGAAC